jgi:glycerol kinase
VITNAVHNATKTSASTALLLGIDQGGSGSRALLLDQSGQRRGYGYRPLSSMQPQPGQVEQSPAAVVDSVSGALADALAMAGAAPADILAGGITSQRDTVFAWDAATGQAIGNAISWQDLRTEPLVAETNDWPLAQERRARLGLFPGAYCGALHMAWRMRHDPAFRAAAAAGRLRVSLSAGWLLQALGRPAEHALDYSLLQGMGIFDPRRKAFWPEWIAALNLPPAALPRPRPTLHHYGELLLDHDGTATAIPVTALIADQQAALFGYDCRNPGQAGVTHGTASFVNAVAGATAPPPGLCKLYLAWELDRQPCYSLEADLTLSGAVVNWMQRLGLLAHAAELGPLAASVPDSGGLVFVPAFTGLGVPREDRSARGLLMGLSLASGPPQIARALLEALGCQLREAVDAITAEAGVSIEELRVGGGIAASDEACQIQADASGLLLRRAADTETGARGAALLAGMGAGVWQHADELPSLPANGERIFVPRSNAAQRAQWMQQWRLAAERAST